MDDLVSWLQSSIVLLVARLRAEAMDSSVDRLIRDYLEQLAGRRSGTSAEAAEEFARLSLESNGNSRGWTFDREELHRR
jgi:hypothetical protein